MLNNINFVALHAFDVHSAFFCHFQSRVFSNDAILMLLIGSPI